MTETSGVLLPTTVVGSHATPSWLLTAIDEIDNGNYGRTDVRETFDDAVNMAILDQERAGVDIISDGEMRRWYFVQSFYRRMSGLAEEPPLRKVGLYGYDSPQRYRAVGKVTVPEGLGDSRRVRVRQGTYLEAAQGYLSRPADAHDAHTTGGRLQESNGSGVGVCRCDQRGAQGARGGRSRLHPA